jgi:hypothetical protein
MVFPASSPIPVRIIALKCLTQHEPGVTQPQLKKLPLLHRMEERAGERRDFV